MVNFLEGIFYWLLGAAIFTVGGAVILALVAAIAAALN